MDQPDQDGDGLADELEQRFGSDPSLSDTDADGLGDLAEFSADIYASTDPRRSDSDQDGLVDGLDALPLDPIADNPRGSPTIDGAVTEGEGWTLLSERPAFLPGMRRPALRPRSGPWPPGTTPFCTWASRALRPRSR